MKPWAKEFYFSAAWQNCRAAFISAKGGLCERCLKRGQYKAGVIVHHRTHLTPDNITDPAVTLSADNLELLCRDCHADEHRKHEKRYSFDEEGRLIPPYSRSGDMG